MKIIIAPDSFKGCLSAPKVCRAVENGIAAVLPAAQTVCLPMADGGEGTAECFIKSCGGEMVNVKTIDSFQEPVTAGFAMTKDKTAVIETAAANGIGGVPLSKLNPLAASTCGTGLLIKEAVKHEAKKIIIGLGGSATSDGGMGALSVLGVNFTDIFGRVVLPCGEKMIKACDIEVTGEFEKYRNVTFIFACDVENPFYGENGAAFVYAPQKGADENAVKLLDEGLKNLAGIFNRYNGADLQSVKGSGAAGGLCGGLYAMLGGEIKSGFSVLSDVSDFENMVKGADLVITGEGKTDRQTAFGKLPKRVCDIAKKYSVPCILLSGQVSADTDTKSMGFVASYQIMTESMTLEYACANAERLITEQIKDILTYDKASD